MIKAIAVDMDGTFLTSKNTYNVARFEKVYSEMQKKNIKFIVASGNQYAQLRSFFPDIRNEITFVSENGALVFENKKIIYQSTFTKDTTKEIMDFLIGLKSNINAILCGAKMAYVLKSANSPFKKFANKYYFDLLEVDSFDILPDDEFVKFALEVPKEETGTIVDLINQKFGKKTTAVSSGHGSVDLIIPGVHKGYAIEKLLKSWEISPAELLAFGDGNNDLEMLKLAEQSYAMANGSAEVKKIANYQAPSNDEEGVLAIIEAQIGF